MLAGTYLKNIRFSNYFEFHKQSHKYIKLNNKKRYPKLLIEKRITNKKEIVIAIGITKQINDNDLKQFKNCDIVIVNIDEKDYKDNKIYSKNQLYSYTNDIYSLIKNNMNYERINILISSQSCLVVELGKLLDDKNDAEIVCYHYEQSKYKWGMIISGKNKGGRVIK